MPSASHTCAEPSDLLYRARDVYRAAAALICLGRWIHRIPTWKKQTDTLTDQLVDNAVSRLGPTRR